MARTSPNTTERQELAELLLEHHAAAWPLNDEALKCHQTWLAGKSSRNRGKSNGKITDKPDKRWIFQHAMFESWRVSETVLRQRYCTHRQLAIGWCSHEKMIFFPELREFTGGYMGVSENGVSNPTKSGWWFGTFFICPYIGDNHPNWLIFFGLVETINQKSCKIHGRA